MPRQAQVIAALGRGGLARVNVGDHADVPDIGKGHGTT
jgi:hypothetical protein